MFKLKEALVFGCKRDVILVQIVAKNVSLKHINVFMKHLQQATRNHL